MNSSSPRRSLGPRSKIGGIVVVALVGIYSLAAPYVNERFGLDLPAMRADSNGQVRMVDAEPGNQRPVAKKPSASRQSTTTESDSRSSDSDERNLYGILRDVGRDTYLSPAGLRYTPGSAEGHRLDHLERHADDDPDRPGSHGVFDGGMEGALRTIDKAYQRAKKGQRTSKKMDDGRTIYTVDMGGRVGYVGGRSGNRKQQPIARRVRIVLDGDRFITAYPM